MSALPKELVRHFTLLKEVDAKLYAPEEQLVKLVSEALSTQTLDASQNQGQASIDAPSSTSLGAQQSSTGFAPTGVATQAAPSTVAESINTNPGVFDLDNIPRRQLYRQTAMKIQEMLVSLEEKNHVLGTANEALQKQLARIENVWPHLENEFTDEAKWGSNSHWAYPDNRTGRTQPERARRDGAAAISAAAQALADEAAARSDARKQALQAKRNQRNPQQESDFDDHDRNHKNEGGKKTGHGKSRKPAESHSVGLGISTTLAANGNPPSKKRKVENGANHTTAAERAAGSAAGTSKAKATAFADTATPDTKKRKALPSSSTQAKRK